MVVLSGVAAAGGLLIDGLYPDPAVAASAFRGNDLATVLVGVPALTLALIGSVRGSLRAQLVWIGMLAYSIYNLAYYVFGAQFNDLFLLHVAAFVSSVFAFGLALTGLDVTSIGERSASRTPVRWISVLLALPAAAIVVLYSVAAVRFAVTGRQPSDVLPMPSERVHLAFALDLTLLVPAVTLAAVQLWRRTAWGYALGAGMCLAVGVYQINYIVQKVFVAEAGVAGVLPFDPRDLAVPAVLLISATVLLLGVRRAPTRSFPDPTGPARASASSVARLLEDLLERRRVPLPHTPGTHQLWTDEHISRGMLAAHLDPDTDAASRRPGTIDATVAWLAGRLPTGARILDLGCGPGLYARRLAEAGFDVVGIDYSERSIEYARAHGGSVRYICGDYRDVVLDETFDAVLLIYLDLGTFSPHDAHRILERVRGWLSPGGTFLFDVATPAHRAGSEHRRDWGVAEEGFWAAAPHAWLSRTVHYPDESLYLDEHVVATATDTRVYRVWERCFTLESIHAELISAGMTVQGLYGDLTGTPRTESSTMLGVSAAIADETSAVPGPGA